MSELLEKDLTPDQRILLNLTSVNTAVNNLQEDNAKFRKILIEGNGDIPLVEKVRNIETFIKEFRYWTKFIFGALIVQTLAFIAGIIVAVFRFLPLLEQLSK